MPTLWAGSSAAPTPVDTASSAPQATLVTSGAINTYGSYTDLMIAADNTLGLAGFWLNVSGQSTGTFSATFATGAAAAEVDFLTAFPLAMNTTRPNQWWCHLPITVPAGTRISVKVKASTATQTVRMQLIPIWRGPRTPDGFTTNSVVGFSGGASPPTFTIVAGNTTTPNTRAASYTQVTASAPFDVRAVMLLIGNNSSVAGTTNLLLTLATGAGGSEVDLPGLTNIHMFKHVNYGFPQPCVGPIEVNIPNGTRIAAIVAASTATANDRDIALGLLLLG